MQIFIWLIPARCGVYGVCCKTPQQFQFQRIRRHLASSVLQCWCQFVPMSMLSNTFHRRGWTENVIITALRWVVKYWIASSKRKMQSSPLNIHKRWKSHFVLSPSQHSTDQCSLHIRCMASSGSWETILISDQLSRRFHGLPTWNNTNSTRSENLLSYSCCASLKCNCMSSYYDIVMSHVSCQSNFATPSIIVVS